jgi:hypothetical protein
VRSTKRAHSSHGHRLRAAAIPRSTNQPSTVLGKSLRTTFHILGEFTGSPAKWFPVPLRKGKPGRKRQRPSPSSQAECRTHPRADFSARPTRFRSRARRISERARADILLAVYPYSLNGELLAFIFPMIRKVPRASAHSKALEELSNNGELERP